jgi:putative transposase
MLEAKGFEVNKSNIQEASWGNFVNKLIYKAESAGRSIREVNPMNTSKTCSHCGKINKELTLRDREFRCEACGFAMDRDRNAAINIRRLGTSLAIKDDLRSLHL